MLVILTLGVGFIAKTSFTVIGFIKTGIRLHSCNVYIVSHGWHVAVLQWSFLDCIFLLHPEKVIRWSLRHPLDKMCEATDNVVSARLPLPQNNPLCPISGLD